MKKNNAEYLPCRVCEKVVHRTNLRLYPNGSIHSRTCKSCQNKRLNELSKTHINKRFNRIYNYRHLKGLQCEKCGFTGQPCQLDVDHIDGDKTNNNIENIQTLCANCHRIKTHKCIL